MRIFFPQLFCFPYLRKNRGCNPRKMSARRHFLSLISHSPFLGPLVFQSFAHSFIFRITPIPRPSRRLRTLWPKPGGTPLVIPIIRPSPPPKPQMRPSLRSALCVLCVSAVSLLLFPFVPLAVPPCPNNYFPLQWEIPFPVITGENQ